MTTPLDILHAASTSVELGSLPRLRTRDVTAAAFDLEASLDEAQLISVLHVTTTGRVGLLFDLRTGLWDFPANVGILLLEEVSEYGWDRRDIGVPLTAASVLTSSAQSDLNGKRRLTVPLYPWAAIELVFSTGRFVAGTDEGIGEAPPDYSGAYDAVVNGNPSWDTPLTGLYASTEV
jgi:hypothetical protein